MSLQDALTLLFNAVAIAFIIITAMDFAAGLIQLFVSCGKPVSQPQFNSQINPMHRTQTKVETQPNFSSELQPDPSTTEQTVSDQPSESTLSTPKVTDRLEQFVAPLPVFDFAQLKLYKLRGESVVRVEDLPIEIPNSLRRYRLHKRDVIKLSQLKQLIR